MQMPYYSLYDDFMLISKDKNSIKAFYNAIDSNETLNKLDKMKVLYSYINKGNVISYWNSSKSDLGILKGENLFARIIKKYNFPTYR